LTSAKRWVLDNRDDGVRCPCCGQFAKVYRRKLDSSMARALIVMWRNGGQDWQRTRGIDNSGNIAKLGLWGLVEADDRGTWRVTDDGVDFIMGKIEMAHRMVLYDGAVLDVDDSSYVDIHQALGDKFDYDELMGER
jgi:hypothetical protein